MLLVRLFPRTISCKPPEYRQSHQNCRAALCRPRLCSGSFEQVTRALLHQLLADVSAHIPDVLSREAGAERRHLATALLDYLDDLCQVSAVLQRRTSVSAFARRAMAARTDLSKNLLPVRQFGWCGRAIHDSRRSCESRSDLFHGPFQGEQPNAVTSRRTSE
jgi:hypothetical protein